MKKTAISLALLALLGATNASAAVLQYAYTATVSNVLLDMEGNGSMVEVASSEVSGYNFAPGQQFAGTIAYDAGLGLRETMPHPWHGGSLSFYTGSMQATLKVAGNGLELDAPVAPVDGGSVILEDAPFAQGVDSLQSFSSFQDRPGASHGLGLWFNDNWGASLDGIGLPSALDLARFPNSFVMYAFIGWGEPGSQPVVMQAYAQMTSLTLLGSPPAEVPEPAGLAIAAGALGALALVRRRRPR